MVRFRYSAINNSEGQHAWSADGNECWVKLVLAGWITEQEPDNHERGAACGTAERVFQSVAEGLEAWEGATGENPWARGCSYPNCRDCLPPHKFSYYKDGRRRACNVPRPRS